MTEQQVLAIVEDLHFHHTFHESEEASHLGMCAISEKLAAWETHGNQAHADHLAKLLQQVADALLARITAE